MTLYLFFLVTTWSTWRAALTKVLATLVLPHGFASLTVRQPPIQYKFVDNKLTLFDITIEVDLTNTEGFKPNRHSPTESLRVQPQMSAIHLSRTEGSVMLRHASLRKLKGASERLCSMAFPT